MHSRKIASLEVSAIGLGCMNMSMGYGKADDKLSVRLLDEALERGYRFFDTATIYGAGHNESLIGDTLARRRNEFVLASKCGLYVDDDGRRGLDGRPESIRRQCEASLKRLKTDVIDLYYMHRLDPAVPIEDTVGALAELVRDGKIREIGLSEMSSATLRRAHAVHPIAAMQSEYSLWSRTPEFKMLATCAEIGTTLVAFSPLGRAFLAGAARDVTRLDTDDIRCTIARPRFEAQAFAANLRLLEPYAAIARRVGCTMAQLALAWLLGQRDVNGQRTIVPIPGTKHVEFMEENAAAGDLELDPATLAELDQLINESTVVGRRYTDDLMASTDSERDRED